MARTISRNRRSLLKLLGLGAVTAPLAAKEILDGEISKLALGQSYITGPLPHVPPSAVAAGHPYYDALIPAAEYVKTIGVPEFVESHLRRSAREVRALDPDIANKRSWSMSVKILTQRERNLEREIEAIQLRSSQRKAAMAWKAVSGLEWPW